MKLERSTGMLLHPTSLPSGSSTARRTGSSTGSRRRAVVVAGVPLGPPDEFRLAVPVAVGIRRLARADREAGGRVSRRARSRTSSRATRTGSRTRRASPEGGARRPGALRAGVGRAARVRGGARRAAHRRRADLRLRRGRRCRRLAGAVRATAKSPARRPTRSARTGQLWGNPLYDWRGAPRDGLPLVARALPAHVRARRPLPRRPLPRLRLLLGDAGAEHDREARTLAARARAPSCSTRSRASSGTCR